MEQGLEKYDVVFCAISHMSRETLEKIAKKVIESQITDVVHRLAQRELPLEQVRNSVAEKLQSNMPAEEAQKFSQELYNETGVDARQAKMVRRRPVSTIEQIDCLYKDSVESKKFGRHERY